VKWWLCTLPATCWWKGVYDTAAADPVVRGGGAADYFEISESARFQMHRPR
jgi:hypothetical protein